MKAATQDAEGFRTKLAQFEMNVVAKDVDLSTLRYENERLKAKVLEANDALRRLACERRQSRFA